MDPSKAIQFQSLGKQNISPKLGYLGLIGFHPAPTNIADWSKNKYLLLEPKKVFHLDKMVDEKMSILYMYHQDFEDNHKVPK